MRVEPGGHFLNWQQDGQANYLARLVFQKPTKEFRIEVDLVHPDAEIGYQLQFGQRVHQPAVHPGVAEMRERLATWLRTFPDRPYGEFTSAVTSK